jgi:hypothetical protein
MRPNNTEASARRTSRAALVILVLTPLGAIAWSFAEGYTSATVDAVAPTGYRAFTTITGPEACDISPEPGGFRIKPDTIELKVGDRLYRDKLVIEAYSRNGEFLPTVPIVIDIVDTDEVLAGRSEWNYAKATKPGSATLLISWLCGSVRGPTKIVITRH